MKIRAGCGSAHAAGFTLIEVLVAIAVLAIAMSLIFGVFQSVLGVADHVDTTAAYQQRISILFSQLQRDIGGLYKGPTGRFQADFEATKSGDAPFLQFTTTSALAFDPRQLPVSMALVGYQLRLSINGVNYELYRTELPFEFGYQNDEDNGAASLLVCEHIRDFQITYTDQFGGDLERWQARSSSVGDKPEDDLFPAAVQVDVELAEGPEKGAQTKRFHYSIFVLPARLIGAEPEDQG